MIEMEHGVFLEQKLSGSHFIQTFRRLLKWQWNKGLETGEDLRVWSPAKT